jgi:tetratricopeptide (TPR) repeat protein
VTVEAGSRIGRYVVVREDEPGTYLAYDPALERRVALRLFDRTDASVDAALASARAVARVKHPSVVAIHDVGTIDGASFVAREWIAGRVLDQWLLERSRSTEQVRAVALQVAQALRAAHAEDVVHGRLDGSRVHVDDAGRAWVDGFAALPGADRSVDGVALVDLIERAMAAIGGERPRWLQAVVAVSDASAGELCRALERPRSPWSHPGLVVATVVGAGLVAILIGRAFVPERARPCEDAARKIVGVWDEGSAAEVRAALQRTGASFAVDVQDEIVRRLDAYATRWIDAHTEACRAAQAPAPEHARLLDRRMHCLERRRGELAAVARVLAEADSDVAAKAIDAVRGLGSVSACLDDAVLRGRTPLPPTEEQRAAVDDVRARLDRARALVVAGRYADARELTGDLEAAARDAGYAPLLAEALALDGKLTGELGDAEVAHERLIAAIATAWTAGHDEVATQAWIDLCYVVGEQLGRWDEALRAAEHARAELARIGGDPGLAPQIETSLGLARFGAADYDAAIEHYNAAIDLRAALDPPDEVGIASELNRIGNASFEQRRYDDALEYIRRALALAEKNLGPAHPAVGSMVNNYGGLLMMTGDNDSALTELQRALEIRKAALGDAHPLVAGTMDNIGSTLDSMGRHDEALVSQGRALALREAALGRDHPEIATSMVNLGNTLMRLGRYDEAERHYARGVAITRPRFGDAHPRTALCLHNLGRAYAAQGRHEEASAMHERVAALYERIFAADHPAVAGSLVNLGIEELALGRIAKAREVLERAERIQRATTPDSPTWAVTAFALARTHDAAGERDAALELARAARTALTIDVDELGRAEIDRFIAARTRR